MEDKRRDLRMLAAACAAALLVVAVLVLLFLSGRSGRKHDEIVLPESRPAQEQEDTPREEESVLTVTADNVQTVLQSMTRLSAFHQTFTVTRRSGGRRRVGLRRPRPRREHGQLRDALSPDRRRDGLHLVRG